MAQLLKKNLAPSILVIDDEINIAELQRVLLQKNGYEVTTVFTGKDALELLKQRYFDLVITDLNMPDMDGLKILQYIKELNPEIQIIILTGYGTIASAVEAIKLGASDYLTKPFAPKEFIIKVKFTLERQQLRYEVKQLKQIIKSRDSISNIIGNSIKMEEVYHQVSRVIASDVTVLITGESGTGKELVARAIHYGGNRANKPFIVVNCAAIPMDLLENELFGHIRGAYTGAHSDQKGLFEEANKGTILLDEISTIPLNIQAKLLRVLQEQEIRRIGDTKSKKINVRILAATNDNLKELTKQKLFREDLLYRIDVVSINLPPLRERKEDILLLANHFFKKFTAQFNQNIEGFDTSALHKIMIYDWPGNVRELENKIQQAVVMATHNLIFPEDIIIPVEFQENSIIEIEENELIIPFKIAKKNLIDEFEKKYLTKCLKRTKGNITHAAKLEKKNRKDFWALLKKHNIFADDFRH